MLIAVYEHVQYVGSTGVCGLCGGVMAVWMCMPLSTTAYVSTAWLIAKV